MSKTVDLARVIIRVLGLFMMVLGGLQLALGVLLTTGFFIIGSIHWNSIAGAAVMSVVQMTVLSLGSFSVGIVLVAASGPLARFAAKHAQNA